MIKLEARCLGHIVYQNNRCKNCKADDKNIYCEDYRKIGLGIYQVNSQEDLKLGYYSSPPDTLIKLAESDMVGI